VAPAPPPAISYSGSREGDPGAASGGKTTRSGEKTNLRADQKVILNVTSDTDDEIHAHIGGPGLRAAGAGWQAGQGVAHPRQHGQLRSPVLDPAEVVAELKHGNAA
jgi:hypothetical protein